MDHRPSFRILLAALLLASALTACSRRSAADDNHEGPPPPPPPVTEPAPAVRPAPVVGNVAVNPTASPQSTNDGAFSPDYAPPPASGPGNNGAQPQH